jgi:hypothetical protein
VSKDVLSAVVRLTSSGGSARFVIDSGQQCTGELSRLSRRRVGTKARTLSTHLIS